jgi:hypothetical protein
MRFAVLRLVSAAIQICLSSIVTIYSMYFDKSTECNVYH